MEYLTAIKENIFQVLSDAQQINYDCFLKSFHRLNIKGGFEELFNNLATLKQSRQLKSIITEFNLASQILQLHPDAEIKYEVVKISGITNPDLTITFNGASYIIQVKRINESIDYEKNKKYYPDTFVPVDDTLQLYKSLEKTVGNLSIYDGIIFLVAQEISPSADMDYITISDTLFGKEQTTLQNNEWRETRDKSGFFISDKENKLSGYICLESQDIGLFFDYKMTLFLNSLHKEHLTSIEELLPIKHIFGRNDFPMPQSFYSQNYY